MAIELDLGRAAKIVEEIVLKTAEKKIAWTTSEQAYSATIGPLKIFIFRAQPGPGWNSMHAALDGNPIFNVTNLNIPGVAKTAEMMSSLYRQNVDQITKLVTEFDSAIREAQFAKALDAISSL